MKCSETHSHPEHKHGPDCGHTAVKHNDHVDYIHDGHLHHPHESHCDEHAIEVSESNPSECKQSLNVCDGHVHGAGCGHEAIPHGDHVDYLVNGELHHVHDGHCDNHGFVQLVNS